MVQFRGCVQPSQSYQEVFLLHYLIVSLPLTLIFSLLVRLAERWPVDLLMHSSPGTTQKCVNVVGTSPGKDHSETEEETRVGRKNADKRLEICFALIA